MMRPVFVTALVIVAAGIVRTYDLVVAMTGGGPGLSSQFPTIYIYEYMFVANLSQGLAASTRAADHGGDHRRALGLLRIRPEAHAMSAVDDRLPPMPSSPRGRSPNGASRRQPSWSTAC